MWSRGPVWINPPFSRCIINMWHGGFMLHLRQELVYKCSIPEAVIHSPYKCLPDILIIKVSDWGTKYARQRLTEVGQKAWKRPGNIFPIFCTPFLVSLCHCSFRLLLGEKGWNLMCSSSTVVADLPQCMMCCGFWDAFLCNTVQLCYHRTLSKLKLV